jgi:hypothetical protein
MSELADCTVPADELLGAAAYRVAELIAESSARQTLWHSFSSWSRTGRLMCPAKIP